MKILKMSSKPISICPITRRTKRFCNNRFSTALEAIIFSYIILYFVFNIVPNTGSFRVMMSGDHMFSIVLKQLKIVYGIISFVSVNMMNSLVSVKFSFEMLFHHISMEHYGFVPDIYNHITKARFIRNIFLSDKMTRFISFSDFNIVLHKLSINPLDKEVNGFI